MSLFRLLFVPVALCAQIVPVGVVRGDLLEWEGTTQAGYVVVRSLGSSSVYRCEYDVRTYSERDGQRMAMTGLKKGDKLEIIADQKNGGCYVRTVRVIDNRAAIVTNPGHRVNLRPPYRTMVDNLYPRGNLTFAGVVLRINPQVMVVRTRTEPEKVILLRDDTRFLSSGLPSELSTLSVNTRVFVRGGKNLNNDLEAYQVVWGQIEGPRGGSF